jgi:hypothetical protein
VRRPQTDEPPGQGARSAVRRSRGS